MDKITAAEAAKLLDISIEELDSLKQQGLINSVTNMEGVEMYSSAQIEQIKLLSDSPSLSEEVALVNNQVQQKIFTPVSRMEMLRKKSLTFGIVAALVFILLLVVTAVFYFLR